MCCLLDPPNAIGMDGGAWEDPTKTLASSYHVYITLTTELTLAGFTGDEKGEDTLVDGVAGSATAGATVGITNFSSRS